MPTVDEVYREVARLTDDKRAIDTIDLQAAVLRGVETAVKEQYDVLRYNAVFDGTRELERFKQIWSCFFATDREEESL